MIVGFSLPYSSKFIHIFLYKSWSTQQIRDFGLNLNSLSVLFRTTTGKNKSLHVIPLIPNPYCRWRRIPWLMVGERSRRATILFSAIPTPALCFGCNLTERIQIIHFLLGIWSCSLIIFSTISLRNKRLKTGQRLTQTLGSSDSFFRRYCFL